MKHLDLSAKIVAETTGIGGVLAAFWRLVDKSVISAFFRMTVGRRAYGLLFSDRAALVWEYDDGSLFFLLLSVPRCLPPTRAPRRSTTSILKKFYSLSPRI